MIILGNRVTEQYYGIILQNLYEKNPGDAWDVPGPPGIPAMPWARPWDPRGRTWDPSARLWDPGDAPGTPGHASRTPGDVSETPQGRPWDLWGPPRTPYGFLMDHKNGHISTNR